MQQMTKTCGNCAYYKPTEKSNGNSGVCCRFPPVPYPSPSRSPISGEISMNQIVMRPFVQHGDRCGEFVAHNAVNGMG